MVPSYPLIPNPLRREKAFFYNWKWLVGLKDFRKYQNHPDDQNDIKDHSNMKKNIEELAVGEFVSLLWFTHESVHHQGG
jgi:hypothetical protein